MAKTIRDAYGEALVRYGAEDPRVVVLDADVSGSTKSSTFAAACPERFFNMGIAEAGMVAVAEGMAASGKIPFVNTFAVFLTSIGLLGARALSSYSRIPVKFAGAYGGLSDAFDGPSHHSIDDLAIMRALPNFKVYVASDARQTDWLVKNAIEDPSPMYLRLSRDAMPELYGENETFETGKAKILRRGADAAVIACGLLAGNAIRAAELLAAEGIEITVVDMFCLKPLDEKTVVACAAETGAVVTAEEHSVIGGLGSAVAEALCRAGKQVPMSFLGLQDCHAECGPYDKLQRKYGLDAAAIAESVRGTIARKAQRPI